MNKFSIFSVTNFYKMMKTIHSYWAYLVLVVLIITVVNAIVGLLKKKAFTEKDLRLGLFTLIFSHIQLLIGLGWYFSSPYYKALKANGSEVMGDAAARLLAIEHPIMMILAIVFITIGWSKHKKKIEDHEKFKIVVIFYGIGLLLMLSKIPWNQWPTA